jgi:Lon protease-like protein
MVENDSLTSEELASLPVFPLPRVVFFPGTRLPLHLFETRYRRMIEDCMSHGPRALSVALLEPGWEADYEGRPPFHRVSGAGRIVDHVQLPNGTHNIVLQGISRVVLEELPADGLLYRRARAVVLRDVVPDGGVPFGDVSALLSCASAVAAAVRKEHPDFQLGVESTDDAGRVADLVADRLIADTTLRQRILETLDVRERVQMLMGPIGELMATLGSQPRRRDMS